MIAQIRISPEGEITATVDTDDIPTDDDERSLLGLTVDDLLDQASRSAISTWLELRAACEDAET